MVAAEGSATRLRRSLAGRPIGLWLAAIGVTVFLVRVVVAAWSSGFPPFFPDSASFATVARRGPFWPRFWFDERPVGFPLLYWLAGRSPRIVVLLQATAYALACAALCGAVWRAVRSQAVAAITTAFVVALCVQTRFSLWSTLVLSESLGLTLATLSLATWLRFAVAPGRRSLWVAVAASLAWVLTRDSNVVPFATVAIPALLAGRVWWRSGDPGLRRSMLHAALLGILVCGYVTVSQDVSERNRYPVLNNIGQRILVDQDMTSWFVSHGMPYDEAVAERAGHSSFDDDFKMLEDPSLAQLKSWSEGSGQRLQLASFVLRADFWGSRLKHDLPMLLAEDLDGYDLHGVTDRLPARTGWLDGPRSTAGLVVWLLLAVTGLALVAAVRRRRLLALVVALALASSLLDLYLSYVGDSVEVQRHVVGPLMRLSLTLVVAVGLGVDAIVRREAPDRVARTRRPGDLASAALAGLMTAALAAAWFGNELRSQDYDPQFARTIVERAGELGGTYYQNGIHNKGPFEMVVYDAARTVTSWGTYWFGISTFVIVVALVVAGAAWVVSRRLGASAMVAFAGAAGVAVHLTLSTSDYAGVLYSRNITSAILALVLTLALVDRPWRSAKSTPAMLVMCGALLGLAVQTLLTTVFAASVIGLFVVARRGRPDALRSAFLVGGSAGVAVLTAPVWYLARGSFDEFWAGWWTYAHFMSSGTGRTLGSQLALGWSQLVDWSGDRPEVLALVIAFAFVTWTTWLRMTRFERQLHLTLIGWVMAAEVELVLSQRYSSHYYSVLAVPLALMAVVLLVRVMSASRGPGDEPLGLRRWRTTALAPLTVVLVVLGVQCSEPFWDGLRVAGSFNGFEQHVRAREQGRGGADRSTRAILDLVSEDGDPLLAWTMYPWTYLDQHRVPATRLSWKSFMLGEIYLGRTGPEYVLPQTWRWFREDMDAAEPAAYVTVTTVPVTPGTPFTAYTDTHFATVYSGPAMQVALRKDLMDGIVGEIGTGVTWRALEGSPPGWNVDDSMVKSTRDTADPLVLGSGACVRLGGTVRFGDPESSMIVRFVDQDGSLEDVMLGFDGRRAWSASDNVQFESVEVGSSRGVSSVALVVGERSAALVVDDKIGAAVRLDGATSFALQAGTGDYELSGLVMGDPSAIVGC